MGTRKNFIKVHPDGVGLTLSVGAAIFEGPFAVTMGLGAIGIDMYQNDPVGIGLGSAALAADTLSPNPLVIKSTLVADIAYGIGQLF